MGQIAEVYDSNGNVVGVMVIDMIRDENDPSLGNDVYTRRVVIRGLVPCNADIAKVVFADGRSYIVYEHVILPGQGYCVAELRGEIE